MLHMILFLNEKKRLHYRFYICHNLWATTSNLSSGPILEIILEVQKLNIENYIINSGKAIHSVRRA